MNIECPIESIKNAITTSSMDWSLDKRTAWVYGVVIGWDDCLESIGQKWGWTDDDIARLKRLNQRFSELEKNNSH